MEARYYFFDIEQLRWTINETIRRSAEYELEVTKDDRSECKIWFPRKGIYFRCKIESAANESILSVSAESPFSILTGECELSWNTLFLQQIEEIIHETRILTSLPTQADVTRSEIHP